MGCSSSTSSTSSASSFKNPPTEPSVNDALEPKDADGSSRFKQRSAGSSHKDPSRALPDTSRRKSSSVTAVGGGVVNPSHDEHLQATRDSAMENKGQLSVEIVEIRPPSSETTNMPSILEASSFSSASGGSTPRAEPQLSSISLRYSSGNLPGELLARTRRASRASEISCDRPSRALPDTFRRNSSVTSAGGGGGFMNAMHDGHLQAECNVAVENTSRLTVDTSEARPLSETTTIPSVPERLFTDDWDRAITALEERRLFVSNRRNCGDVADDAYLARIRIVSAPLVDDIVFQSGVRLHPLVRPTDPVVDSRFRSFSGVMSEDLDHLAGRRPRALSLEWGARPPLPSFSESDLSVSTIDCLNNFLDVNTCRRRFNEEAEKSIGTTMNRFVDVRRDPAPRQNSCVLSELLQDADIVRSELQRTVMTLVDKASISPDKEPRADGARIVLREKRGEKTIYYKNFTLAPNKEEKRCREKAENEYGGHFDRLIDIVRCSVVAPTIDKLVEFTELALSTDLWELVGMKNRCREGSATMTGYRDVNFTVRIQIPGASRSHLCEIQLHFAPILALKKDSHRYYEIFRNTFAGSTSYVQWMDLLEDLTKGYDKNTSIDEIITGILNGDDSERLLHLFELCDEKLADRKLAVNVARRLLALQEQRDDAGDPTTLLKCLSRVGKALLKMRECSDEVVDIFQRVVDERERILFENDVSVLSAVNSLGLALLHQGKVDEAIHNFRRVVNGLESDPSNKDSPLLLGSITNLASCLEKRGEITGAIILLEQSVRGAERAWGAFHLETMLTVLWLARLYQLNGEIDKALEHCRRAREGNEKVCGKDHPTTLKSYSLYASLLQEKGEHNEALRWLVEAFEGNKRKHGPEHKDTIEAENALEEARLLSCSLQDCR